MNLYIILLAFECFLLRKIMFFFKFYIICH